MSGSEEKLQEQHPEQTITAADFPAVLANLRSQGYLEESDEECALTIPGRKHANARYAETQKPLPTPDTSSDGCWGGAIFVGIIIFVIAAMTQNGKLPSSQTNFAVPSNNESAINPVQAEQSSWQPVAEPVPGVEYRDPMPIKNGAVVVVQMQSEIRNSPGHNNKPNEDILNMSFQGERFNVVGGPEYVDGLWWWQISNDRCGNGWIAQTKTDGKVILSSP